MVIARKWTVVGALALLMGNGAARAEHELDWTDFDTDGQTIGTAAGDVRVSYNTNRPITVYADGGTQVDGIVYVFHQAALDMTGGSVGYEVDAQDLSTVSISGGFIEYGVLARDKASVLVSGGDIGDITAMDRGFAALSGGIVRDYFDTFDASTAIITGGSIGEDVSALGDSAIVIRGGSIGRNLIVRQDATVFLLGGEIGGDIISFNNGVVNVFGRNLRLENPVPAWGGGFSYDLTGTLADGTPLNHTAYVLATGRINLIDVASLKGALPLQGLLMGGLVPASDLVRP